MGKDFLYPLFYHLKTSTGCTPQFAGWLEGQIVLLNQEHEIEKDVLISSLLSLQPDLFCEELDGYGYHSNSGSTWCSRHCEGCGPNKECAQKWLEMKQKKR